MPTNSLVACGLMLVLACWTASDAKGQLAREADVTSIGGTLRAIDDSSDDYTFKSDGAQILVVDLDADIFMTPGGDHADDGGGCDCDTVAAESTGTNGSGCSDDGPGKFRLEVLKGTELVCAAGKPMRPGWDRDPRLACLLKDESDRYVLRVRLVGEGEEMFSSELPKTHLYMLNVSLRDLPSDDLALEEQLTEAIGRSGNQLRKYTPQKWR